MPPSPSPFRPNNRAPGNRPWRGDTRTLSKWPRQGCLTHVLLAVPTRLRAWGTWPLTLVCPPTSSPVCPRGHGHTPASVGGSGSQRWPVVPLLSPALQFPGPAHSASAPSRRLAAKAWGFFLCEKEKSKQNMNASFPPSLGTAGPVSGALWAGTWR